MGVIVGMRRVCLCGDAGEWLACMVWAREWNAGLCG